MSRKQLCLLFLYSAGTLTVGAGLLPLLPVYATRLGARPGVVGYYLSFTYLAITAGTLAAGWISDKLGRLKPLLIAAAVMGIPTISLMGRATSMGQLAGLTAVVWFSGGMQLALINILAGLFANEKERGKVFGVLVMANPLGALVGGLTVGPMADRWGYPTMFAVLAVFWCIWPMIGLLLEDKTAAQVRTREASTIGTRSGFARGFYFLLLASVATGVATFARGLGMSLMMNELGFSAAAISGTAAVGGAVGLPLPAVIGWFSDRLSRKRLLALCYFTGAAGLLALTVSESLWHFWATTALASVVAAHSAVGSALVTDLVPQVSLGRGLSLFGATTWVGGIIGYASTGQAIERLGTTSTFLGGAFLALLAILLLFPIREARREEAVVKVTPA